MIKMKPIVLFLASLTFLGRPNGISADVNTIDTAVEDFDMAAWAKELEDRMDRKHSEAMAALDREHARAVQQRKERISSLEQARAKASQQLAELEEAQEQEVAVQDERQLQGFEARVAALKSVFVKKLSCLNVQKSSRTALVFEGCNVHVRNGERGTGFVNGLGNLIIGYNEPTQDGNRAGSHNLVVGRYQQYNSVASILGGESNSVFGGGSHSSITGGSNNAIFNGEAVTIAGGNFNEISSQFGSTILGGQEHEMYGDASTIIGGYLNRVDVDLGTIVGGVTNALDNEDQTVILGGVRNEADAYDSAICGGAYGLTSVTTTTNARASVILGGNFSETTEYVQTVPPIP